jgi:hypothetical protein
MEALLPGPRRIVTSSDELMLSSTAQSLIRDEEEALKALLGEILDRNVKSLHRELRRTLLREGSASPEDLLHLDSLKTLAGWKEVGAFIRDFLRTKEGGGSDKAKSIWNLIEYRHSIEEETLKLLTCEIPAGPELAGKVRAALPLEDFTYDRLIEILGIADDDFNLAELVQGVDAHRAELPPSLLESLNEIMDGEEFSWEMDELRDLSMALKKVKERNFPQDLLTRFEEIRKARNPMYLYTFSPAAKSIFIGGDAGKAVGAYLAEKGLRQNGLETALTHAALHICQDVIEDHSAPGAPRKMHKAERELGRTFQSISRPFVPLMAKGLSPSASAQSLRAVLSTPLVPGQTGAAPASAGGAQMPGGTSVPSTQSFGGTAPSPQPPVPQGASASPTIPQPAPPLPTGPATLHPKLPSRLPPPITKGGGLYQLPPDAARADIPKRKPPEL